VICQDIEDTQNRRRPVRTPAASGKQHATCRQQSHVPMATACSVRSHAARLGLLPLCGSRLYKQHGDVIVDASHPVHVLDHCATRGPVALEILRARRSAGKASDIADQALASKLLLRPDHCAAQRRRRGRLDLNPY
jgi:hypothetical protein